MCVENRAHARERVHKDWFTVTETVAMDSVPLVCRLMFEDQSTLLASANVDVEKLATRLMNIIGMIAIDEETLVAKNGDMCVARGDMAAVVTEREAAQASTHLTPVCLLVVAVHDAVSRLSTW